MSRAALIIEGEFSDLVQHVVDYAEQHLGDYDSPELSHEEQRARVKAVLSGKPDPGADMLWNKDEAVVAENCWTLCIDAAVELVGRENQELAEVVARAACEKLGYGRSAQAEAVRKLQGRRKSSLGAALRALQYGSFASAVNDLKMGDDDPKDIEQELIWRALNQGVDPSRRRRRHR